MLYFFLFLILSGITCVCRSVASPMAPFTIRKEKLFMDERVQNLNRRLKTGLTGCCVVNVSYSEWSVNQL